MAEHRMYLPLAAVVTIVVLGLDAIVHRWAKIIFAGLAVALTLVTVDRNKVYGSELMLWSDTVERVPYNARAHYNLGLLLAAWGTDGADINDDGNTNGADLGLLLSAWGQDC